jgi:molybdenum cofactor cytidylyltransferase
MGEAKLLTPIGEKSVFEITLLNHMESSLSAICAVVAGWIEGFSGIVAAYAGCRVSFVEMERPCQMSDSLKAGWKYLQDDVKPGGVMISLADKPLVDPATIDVIVRSYLESGKPICVPAYGGRWGHPVIISSTLDTEIMELEGDRGARDVLTRHRDLVHEVNVDTDGVLFDVDNQEDLNILRSRLTTDG